MKKLISFIVIILMLAGSASAAPSIAWDPPTTNSDGSPLTDLAGYRVYVGTEMGTYTYLVVDVGAVETHTLALPTGQFHIVVTAYDMSGNESVYSNELVFDQLAPGQVRIYFIIDPAVRGR